MFIVQTQIFISQVPTTAFPNRNNEFSLQFSVEIEANDSWADFTNECKITLPKNYTYISTTGNPVKADNTASNIGGFSVNVPLFLRGDEVTVIVGYRYKRKGVDFVDTATIFSGYISKVSSKKPFVLECEDNMWKLKQLPAPNKLFKAADYNLEDMLAEMLTGTPYTVNMIAQTDIGDFRTLNESVMDVLARLRKDYHIEAYFRGNELRAGYLVVYMDPGNNYNFVFQENIIEDELEYIRRDDVVLSAVGYSVNTIAAGGITKDGHAKTKQVRYEVLVTLQNRVFTSKITPPGQKADYPPNQTGQRRTFYYADVTNTADLVSRVQSNLTKYYYTGFKGKFTTFGIPYVRQGDNVSLYDAVLPERNGQYKVKSVEYKMTIDSGLRQTIELDFQIKVLPNYTKAQINGFIKGGFPA